MSSSDVAIIGMACRYPGDATSPQAFYDMLLRGEDAWSEVPPSRFDVNAFYHPSKGRQGNTVARGGYFLREDASKWDARFFACSPAEARAMDPQQRLLLEVAYESLESAGLSMAAVADTETGCYVGAFGSDYKTIVGRDIRSKPVYSISGCSSTILSNRVSWFFNLRGPSLTVDTACSSSLTALNLACEAINSSSNSTRCALVGGTSLLLDPDDFCSLSALGFLSPDSRCFAFDSRANGYARGDGLCMLVVKHIDDAIRDGDPIRAVIRASGINSDGRTAGIALPNGEAQERLIRKTYQLAGLDPADTQYVEFHGTGTKTGDPIEMAAVTRTLAGKHRSVLYGGSVKTQVGHTEAAAGLAGLVKCVMAMENGIMPPHLNFVKPNRRLRLDEANVVLPTSPRTWPPCQVRRCSVNSFGFGGTNAHVIIDDARSYLLQKGYPKPQPDGICPGPMHNGDHLPRCGPEPSRVFVFSAPDRDTLARQRLNYANYLASKGSNEKLANLSYTLSQRRSVFQWRDAVTATSAEELEQALKSDGQAVSAKPKPRILYVFTGQGAQWHAMGRELVMYDVYATSIREATAYLKTLGCTWDAWDELMATEETSNIYSAEYSQPLCTALQMALVDLLAHLGVVPSAVVGHSSGEIACAYASGALSRHDCLKIAYYRGVVSQKAQTQNPGGGMMVVGLSAKDVAPRLAHSDAVSIGCVNSTASVTLTGDKATLLDMKSRLCAEHVFCRMLVVDNAYHGAQMRAVSEEYRACLGDFSPQPSSVTFYSTVLGKAIPTSQLGPAYWVRNLCNPVEFVSALDDVMHDDADRARLKSEDKLPHLVVELGPHSALAGPIKQVKTARGLLQGMEYYSVLSRGRDACTTLTAAMASLWMHGVPLHIDRLNQIDGFAGRATVLTDLPLHSWNHSTSYWHESSASNNINHPGAPRHDLIGLLKNAKDGFEPTWRNWLRVSELPWLKAHQVQGDVIFPAAGMLCAVIEALRQQSERNGYKDAVSGYEVRDVSIPQALVIPSDDAGVEVQLCLHPAKQSDKTGWFKFTFSSYLGNECVQHMHGLAQVQFARAAAEIDAGRERREEATEFQRQLQAWPAKHAQPISKDACYESWRKLGLNYGKPFQGVSKLYQDGLATSFEVQIQDVGSSMPGSFESDYVIHPTSLDALLHPILAAVATDPVTPQAWVPTTITSVQVSSSTPNTAGTALRGICRPQFVHSGELNTRIVVGDGTDAPPCVVIDGLIMTGLGSAQNGPEPVGANKAARLYSHPVWKLDLDLVEPAELRRTADKKYGRDLDMAAFCRDGRHLVDDLCHHAVAKLEPKLTSASLPMHLRKYFDWMRQRSQGCEHVTAPGGSIVSPPGEAKLTNGISHGDDSTMQRLDAFCQRYPVDGKLLRTVYTSLEGIFCEESVPIAVLMADDGLGPLYRAAHGLAANMQIFRDWFDLRADKTPGMSVVEIGAGTASTTLPILQSLTSSSSKRFSSWTFTDISPGWFEKAKSELAAWDEEVNYKLLDIDKDPVEQGFEEGIYDVLLAVNVLHATKDIHKTLRHCRQLLKPGGHLVLGEYTNRSDVVSFITGILPGWWAAEDGRQNGPLLQPAEWESALVQAGFSRPQVSLTDSNDDRFYRMSNIVSTKLVEDVQVPAQTITIVLSDEAGEHAEALARSVLASLEPLWTSIAIARLADMAIDSRYDTVISLLEYESPLLDGIDEMAFQKVQSILVHCKALLWVTRSDAGECPSTRIISGLLRTVRSEDTSRRLHELHLARGPTDHGGSTRELICRQLQRLLHPVPGELDEAETVERHGQFYIPRYMPEDTMNENLARSSRMAVAPRMERLVQAGRPLKLTVAQPGSLDSLQFVEDATVDPLGEDEVEVEIRACGLNFLDVMIAMGEIPRSKFGVEAAGIVRAVGGNVAGYAPGDRVLILAPGVMRTVFRASPCALHKIPTALSLEDAASIPVVYTTAYHALVELARLQPGESVLIHAAAGGLGQALIQIARMLGAEIYCTVSNEAKKQAIMALGVVSENIFSSRGLSFEKGIKRVTGGRGVDVIVNSLAGEALRRSWLCLAAYGRFIEVGKMDLMSNGTLEMRPFLTGTTFAGCNLEHMMIHHPHRIAALVSKVMQLFDSDAVGIVRPITVHDFTHVTQAFRELQRGAHIGKLVLSITPDSRVPVASPTLVDMKLKPDATYLLVGGLGGLGRGQALFMAEHGARHLAFISRSGGAGRDAQAVIRSLSEQGVQAKVYAGDITDHAALKRILEDIAQNMPPFRGVIHGAMQLDDSVFHKMTFAQWVAATRPKVQGSWNLHQLLPDTLDFFIVLSSLAGIIGSVSQANYAAGNTYQDALAYYRRSKGLPAQSINLGIVGGLGYVAEHKDVAAHLGQFGLASVDEAQFFHLLRCAIAGTADAQSPLPGQVLVGAGSGGALRAARENNADVNMFWLTSQAPFSHLRRLGDSTSKTATGLPDGGRITQLIAQLARSSSSDEAVQTTQQILLERMAKVICLSVSDMDVSKPVYAYGVDSLVAVELRNWLAAELKSELSIFDLTSTASISDVGRKIASRSMLVKAELRSGTSEA